MERAPPPRRAAPPCRPILFISLRNQSYTGARGRRGRRATPTPPPGRPRPIGLDRKTRRVSVRRAPQNPFPAPSVLPASPLGLWARGCTATGRRRRAWTPSRRTRRWPAARLRGARHPRRPGDVQHLQAPPRWEMVGLAGGGAACSERPTSGRPGSAFPPPSVFEASPSLLPATATTCLSRGLSARGGRSLYFRGCRNRTSLGISPDVIAPRR